MTCRWPTFALALATILACADDGPAGDEVDSSSDDTSSEATDSTGSTDSSTTETDSTETDSTDTDSTETDSTDTGPGECTPEADASLTFELLGVDAGQQLDWSLRCSVSVAADARTGYMISLSECEMLGPDPTPAPVELELFVDSNPSTEPLPLVQGKVLFHWVQQPPFYAGRWFTIRPEASDTLLLAGLEGPSLLPPNSPDFDFDPLGVDFVAQDCEPFDVDQCATGQRWALELGWDDQTAVIADSNFGYVGQLVSYLGIVDAAIHHDDVVCDDFPDASIEALMFLIPEG